MSTTESDTDGNSINSSIIEESTIQDSNGKQSIYKVLNFFKFISINLALPFINGMMLGFGEIFAHEIAFKWNWSGAKVSAHRRQIGPGVVSKPVSDTNNKEKSKENDNSNSNNNENSLGFS